MKTKLPKRIEDAIEDLMDAGHIPETGTPLEAAAHLRAAVMAEIGAAQERGIAQMKDAMRRAVEDATARAEKAEAALHWLPLETAPHDRVIEVYAPEYEGLPALVTLCEWHPDAGFCIDALREPTHWRPHVPPALAQPEEPTP